MRGRWSWWGLIDGLAGIILVGGCTKPSAQPSRVAEVSHVHGLAVNSDGPEPLWVATHFGLFRGPTADKGWLHPGGPRHDYMGFSAAPGPVFFVSGHEQPSGWNMGLRRSNDGVTWAKVAHDGQVDFHVMAAGRSTPVAIYGWYSKLYRSFDQGRTWDYPAAMGLPPAAERGPYSPVLALAVHPTDPKIVLAATEQGLYLSKNGGMTFSGGGSGPVLALAFAPSDGQVIYATLHNQGVARTQDGGARWETLPWPARQDYPWFLAVDPKTPDRLYAAGRATVFRRSDDGGATWTQIWP